MSNLSFNEAINNLSDDDVKVRKEAIESLVGTTDETAIEVWNVSFGSNYSKPKWSSLMLFVLWGWLTRSGLFV